MLENKNIVLGVTGGIAAYKAVHLASRLCAAGATVKTVMTPHALHLVGPKSFQAVTQSSVHTDPWTDITPTTMEHIDLGEWADLFVIAPATANILGKMANGICDDLLSTLLCASWRKKILMAPAMNVNMWDNPAVQRNLATLTELGITTVGPEAGRLACGTEGMGRMAEPEQIIIALEALATTS
jgi:phosphopantothenoylcysteine decarboxylase/phosphopantothenate--cysteine ligase